MKLKARTKARIKLAVWAVVVASSAGMSYGYVKSAVIQVLHLQPDAEKSKDDKSAANETVLPPSVAEVRVGNSSAALGVVPEPSSVLLLGAGSTLLLRRGKSARR